ncbi:MAG TPA: hypothetical protein VFI49_00385 [Rudaea sp.]|nr:hypothetical protein [Rudaea sp.]
MNEPVEPAVNTGGRAAQLYGSVKVMATVSPPDGAGGENVMDANAG